jgi:hypothetical protein
VNTNGNWTQLAAACDSSPWCMAVNTNGWMKSALLPQAQWSNSFSDVCKGLLTKGGHKQPVVGCNTFHGGLRLVVQMVAHELLQPTRSLDAFLEQLP